MSDYDINVLPKDFGELRELLSSLSGIPAMAITTYEHVARIKTATRAYESAKASGQPDEYTLDKLHHILSGVRYAVGKMGTTDTIDVANKSYMTAELDRALAFLAAPPEREPAQPVDRALAKAAEILANFKASEHNTDGTLERKLEEWQACYAMLFKQMTDLVASIRERESAQPVEKPETALWLLRMIETTIDDAGMRQAFINKLRPLLASPKRESAQPDDSIIAWAVIKHEAEGVSTTDLFLDYESAKRLQRVAEDNGCPRADVVPLTYASPKRESGWVKIRDFRGEPNSSPLAWWWGTDDRMQNPDLDEVLLDENGEICGKGGCGAMYYTHIMLAVDSDFPKPPTTEIED